MEDYGDYDESCERCGSPIEGESLNIVESHTEKADHVSLWEPGAVPTAVARPGWSIKTDFLYSRCPKCGSHEGGAVFTYSKHAESGRWLDLCSTLREVLIVEGKVKPEDDPKAPLPEALPPLELEELPF